MTDVSVEAGETSPSATPQGQPPITSFAELGVSEVVREALGAMGYVAPTEVQVAMFTPAMAGRDLLVQAKTGSGKTAAFGIPLIERLVPGGAEPRKPKALVLAPTRELAVQVSEELCAIATKKGTRFLAVYGGTPMGRQTAALADGVDAVVGTPGRLLDHIRRGTLSLSAVNHVVLDEADEMLSMGFWEDVTELLRLIPQERQTTLLSATLPYQLAATAAQFLRQPERVDLSGDLLTVEGITNCIYHVLPEQPKPRQFLYVLETEQPESALVFCNTRNEAEMIAKYLTQSGFVAEALTGNFRQKERERVMERIKTGELRYMVATDVASRGIDINDLSHVFNYALPEFPEVYVHRVGRTGRIGKLGTAISLVDGKGLGTLSVLEREYQIKFQERKLPPEDETLRRRSERIMKELSEKASVAEVGQHLPVAQEILAAVDAQQVVAFLLKAYFNGQSTQVVPSAHPGPTERREGRRDFEPRDARESREHRDGEPDDGGARRGRRGRRRRRRSRDRDGFPQSDGTIEARSLPVDQPAVQQPPPVNGSEGAVAVAAPVSTDDWTRLWVNIGFDDGFKGRGSVAKKIAALAGLNDGIVVEVESRNDHAVLKVSPEVADLVIDRVDGAQLGKKVISVNRAS